MASGVESDGLDGEQEIQTLKDVYSMLYKNFKSRPKPCVEIEELKAYQRKLADDFPMRKQACEKLLRQSEIAINDPRVKERGKFIPNNAHSLLPITLLSVAKAALLKTEIGGSQQILAELAHEEAELKAKLNGIEQKNRESYRNILKALADTEKAIKDIEIFLGRPYEDNLAAENSELKKKLKGLNRELKIEDDNCSSVSSISSVSAIPAHMPVVEKISTNVTDYFKNPNDFSFMRGTPPRQKRPPTSPAGKKAQPLKPQNFAIERSPHKRQSPRSTGPIVKKVRTSPQQLESTKSIIAVASQPKNKRKQKEPKSLTTHLEEMQQLRPSAPKRKPDAADSYMTTRLK